MRKKRLGVNQATDRSSNRTILKAESRQLHQSLEQTANPEKGSHFPGLNDEAVLRRAAVALANRKADRRSTVLGERARDDGINSFDQISKGLSDDSAIVRSAAVRALYEINPELAASFLNRALDEGSLEDRRRIGLALAGTGSTVDLNNDPGQEDPRKTYGEISRLFLLAKAGQVQSLIQVIEDHPNTQLRLAVIKLLSLRDEDEVLPVFYHLAMRASLLPEIRSAVMEALFKINQKNKSCHGIGSVTRCVSITRGSGWIDTCAGRCTHTMRLTNQSTRYRRWY